MKKNYLMETVQGALFKCVLVMYRILEEFLNFASKKIHSLKRQHTGKLSNKIECEFSVIMFKITKKMKQYLFRL